MNSVAQRLKDLSETDEDDEGLVRVAKQKRKVAAPYALTPKKAKKTQLVSEPRAFVILSIILRHIKTRATKANLKIGDKEWAICITRNKEDPTSSSSDNKSTNDTLISPLHKHASSTQLHPPPSPLHLDKFRRVAPREPLTDAQRFPLAFINDNPTPTTPFSEVLFFEPVVREKISVQAPVWMQHDYVHTPFEAFKGHQMP